MPRNRHPREASKAKRWRMRALCHAISTRVRPQRPIGDKMETRTSEAEHLVLQVLDTGPVSLDHHAYHTMAGRVGA